MNLKNRKRLLWAIDALLLACMVAAVAYAMAPLEPPDGSAKGAGDRRPAAGKAADGLPPLDAYARAWQRELRRLVDTPPVGPTPTAPVPLPSIRLIGTVVDDPSAGYGIFRSGDGHAHLVRVGEGLEGVRLLAVEVTSAKVEFRGRSVTLKVEDEAARK